MNACLKLLFTLLNKYPTTHHKHHIAKAIIQNYSFILHNNICQCANVCQCEVNELKSFIKSLGFQNFTQFQTTLLSESFSRYNFLSSKTRDFHSRVILYVFSQMTKNSPTEYLQLETIDRICTYIHQSKQLILFASPTITKLLTEFQVDMRILGISCFIYDNQPLAVDDYIWVILPEYKNNKTETELSLSLSQNTKYHLCFSQNIEDNQDFETFIQIPKTTDLFLSQCLLLYYINEIKARYLEKYFI